LKEYKKGMTLRENAVIIFHFRQKKAQQQ